MNRILAVMLTSLAGVVSAESVYYIKDESPKISLKRYDTSNGQTEVVSSFTPSTSEFVKGDKYWDGVGPAYSLYVTGGVVHFYKKETDGTSYTKIIDGTGAPPTSTSPFRNILEPLSDHEFVFGPMILNVENSTYNVTNNSTTVWRLQPGTRKMISVDNQHHLLQLDLDSGQITTLSDLEPTNGGDVAWPLKADLISFNFTSVQLFFYLASLRELSTPTVQKYGSTPGIVFRDTDSTVLILEGGGQVGGVSLTKNIIGIDKTTGESATVGRIDDLVGSDLAVFDEGTAVFLTPTTEVNANQELVESIPVAIYDSALVRTNKTLTVNSPATVSGGRGAGPFFSVSPLEIGVVDNGAKVIVVGDSVPPGAITVISIDVASGDRQVIGNLSDTNSPTPRRFGIGDTKPLSTARLAPTSDVVKHLTAEDTTLSPKLDHNYDTRVDGSDTVLKNAGRK